MKKIGQGESSRHLVAQVKKPFSKNAWLKIWHVDPEKTRCVWFDTELSSKEWDRLIDVGLSEMQSAGSLLEEASRARKLNALYSVVSRNLYYLQHGISENEWGRISKKDLDFIEFMSGMVGDGQQEQFKEVLGVQFIQTHIEKCLCEPMSWVQCLAFFYVIVRHLHKPWWKSPKWHVCHWLLEWNTPIEEVTNSWV